MRRARSRQQVLICGILAVATLAGRSAAQDTTSAERRARADLSYRDRLLGVFDAASGQPVAGAEVIDLMSGTTARTTRTGTVSLGFLADGVSLIRIRKLGFEMRTMAVAISPADTIPLTIVLQSAVQLPEVVTTGRVRYLSPQLRGFEERRLHQATGYFVSDSVLRKEGDRTLANVLRTHIPGIVIDQRGRFQLLDPAPSCQTAFSGSPPPPDVYLDGVPLPHPPPPPNRDFATGGMQPFDLSEFSVWELAGVEYYPDAALAPAEFASTARGCGVLLLWTRER